MANAAVDIGTGASAVFSGTSLSLNFTSMDLGEQSIEVIDTTHLGTSGFKTIMGGDLKDPGEWTFEFQWDNEAGPDPSPTAELVTVTFPQSTSNGTSAATYAATGIIRSIKYPTLGVEELQMGTLIFKPDGGATAPTYTDGV
jgi:hypothetical protein